MDLNVAFGKSGATGPGPELSATLYTFPRLRLSPMGYCAWVSDVKTHGGKASASQCGGALRGEVPFLALRHKKVEIAAIGAVGFQRSRFHYDVVEGGHRISGVKWDSGVYTSFGLQVRYRFNDRWSTYFSGEMVAYGDPTGDALGKSRFLGGVSRHFDVNPLSSLKKIFAR